MAKQPEKSEAGKRRVKNPETFRERAVKATEEGEKPQRKRYIGVFFGKIAALVKWPFQKLGSAKLFKRQPFTFLGKVFRFIGRILFPKYFRESWRELKLVTWPGWKLSRQLTFAVLMFAIVFGATVALIDYGLDKLFRNILLR